VIIVTMAQFKIPCQEWNKVKSTLSNEATPNSVTRYLNRWEDYEQWKSVQQVKLLTEKRMHH
jgi:uncharacterized protein YmfQ (DUF2313 family)